MLTRIIALDNLCTNKILRIFINKEKDKIRVKENRVIFSLAHSWFIMWMLCGNRFRLWFHIVWQLVGSVRHSCWQFLRRKFDKSIYSHCPLAVCFLWMAELVVVKKKSFYYLACANTNFVNGHNIPNIATGNCSLFFFIHIFLLLMM